MTAPVLSGLARFRPSPNFSERRDGLLPTMIIVHYTGMTSGKAAEDWLCNDCSEVSSHYIVHEDGRIVQLVPEEKRAWHAGRSRWRGLADINSASIGIEIVNPGHSLGYPDFPCLQIDAVIRLCREILFRWHISPANVLAHSDVAPGRKIDPGEKFPWDRLHAAGVGHYVTPAAPDEEPRQPAAEELRRVQEMLARYGYGIEPTGEPDPRTRIVIEAFQRHFRPQRVDGIADRSTVATLQELLDSLEQGAAPGNSRW